MVNWAEDKSPNLANMFLKLLVVLLPLICSRPAVGQQTLGEKVFKAASPSVVTVQSGDSTGTAFLVRDKNTFVTAAHVIEDGAVPVIRFGKGSFLAVRSISYSKALDLAILETEDPFPAKPLALGDKDKLSPGASVFAIGTALGALTNTLTDGMISGSRKAGSVNLVQVSSPFSPGMSGGPVLSKDSKVLGVISFSFTEGQNLNIAVAAKHVRELLAQQAKSAEVVCAELREAKVARNASGPSGGTSLDPTPKPDRVDGEQRRQAREQALADVLSEVRSIVDAAVDGAYRIYYDSSSMEDWKLLNKEIDRWQKELPLVVIAGESNESDISGRLARYCTNKEYDLLAENALSIARAMAEMELKWGIAILDFRSEITSKAKRSQSFQEAKDSTIRTIGLGQDFLELVIAMHGSPRLLEQLSPKYYGNEATYLGVQADYDRPNVAAVKWKIPSRESDFRVGDVINGLRLFGSGPTFADVNNWKDVSNFLTNVKGTVNVEVRVRDGRSFYITISK